MRLATLSAAVLAALVFTVTAGAGPDTLVVPKGQPLQIALVNDLTGVVSSFGPGISNAVRFAVASHPTLRGFRVQINTYDNQCGVDGGPAAAANAVVANPQNAGVIGQICSFQFDQALPIYEAADVVTISGSATSPALPAFGPTVFNRVVVDDTGFDSWYAQVTALPSDLAWSWGATVLFGEVPGFGDLYFDATSLLLSDLKRVSHLDRAGNLVLDRAALARAVRSTRHYEGVTCTVTLDPATGNRIDDPDALARCAAANDEDG